MFVGDPRLGANEARSRAADVTKSGDVQNYVNATLEAYGAIDCFFNNAGIEGKVAPTQEYDEAVFDAVISVNLKANSDRWASRAGSGLHDSNAAGAGADFRSRSSAGNLRLSRRAKRRHPATHYSS